MGASGAIGFMMLFASGVFPDVMLQEEDDGVGTCVFLLLMGGHSVVLLFEMLGGEGARL